MPFKLFLFSSLLIFLFSGCYTTNNFGFVDMQVMEPAALSLPDTVLDLAVVNSQYAPSRHNALAMANTDSLVARYSKATLDGFTAQTDSVRFFRHVVPVGNGRQYFPSGFAWSDSILHSQLSDLCDTLGVEAIVGLDTIWIRNLSRPQELIQRMLISSRWGLYNVQGKKNIYWSTYSDTIVWFPDKEEKICLQKEHRFPTTLSKVVEEYGKNDGNKMAMLLVPSWKWTDRMIYFSGNETMKKATELAMDNKWKDAAVLWSRMVNSENKNIAAKATYNMALASEMLGHLKIALGWASQSYHVYNNEEHKQNCRDYIRILATRMMQEKRLKRQFGN